MMKNKKVEINYTDNSIKELKKFPKSLANRITNKITNEALVNP